MINFESASRDFEMEVDSEAARIIESGEAAPYEAVAIARERVLRRRRLNRTTGHSIAEMIQKLEPTQ